MEHERIRTTQAKAKFLRPLIEKTIALAKKATPAALQSIQGILTTESERKKVV